MPTSERFTARRQISARGKGWGWGSGLRLTKHMISLITTLHSLLFSKIMDIFLWEFWLGQTYYPGNLISESSVLMNHMAL